MRVKELHPKTFTALVMFGDEGAIKRSGGGDELVLSDAEHGTWGEDSMTLKRHRLAKLAHLKLESTRPVDDRSTVSFDPGQDLLGQIDALKMAPGMGRGAHAIEIDPFRRGIAWVDHPLPDFVELVVEPLGLQAVQQWWQPRGVFIKDMNGR